MKTLDKISESMALNRLKKLCSRSEKSESDIHKKLTEWKLDDKTGKILSILRAEKFVDNSRFARAFAVDKIRLNKWGKYKVGVLLKNKGISESQIREALSVIDYSEYQQMIFSELNKKKKTLKITDPYQLKSKIFSFGNQRGYENELINEFLSSHD
jgi:regulatory protein